MCKFGRRFLKTKPALVSTIKVYQKQFVCAQHGFKIEHFDGKSVQEICLECGHKELCSKETAIAPCVFSALSKNNCK